MRDLKSMREEYMRGKLNKSSVEKDPVLQFKKWMDESIEAAILHPTAMNLSTVGRDMQPSSRIVLLKEFDEKGFIFYTNYNSRKARELSENPRASLLFFWNELEREVRIEGLVEKVSGKEGDDYFSSRPRNSQISASISEQSRTVPHRKFLEEAFNQFAEENPGSIKRPDFWGGYRLLPHYFEFWQGREDRLHDRLAYTLRSHSWKIRRLCP
ncbi:MAG: pyridoxamine 5'-phosphate oxidase [Bacteroidota bacterium]|nr:pyridoxamine 5'-phosphate oxidase [Bacteroidota bacterium]